MSKTLGEIFTKHKLMYCKREASNLKILLCSSNISTNKSFFKTRKCRKSCFSSHYITETELLEYKNQHQSFIMKSNFNCQSPNVIHVIIRSGCSKEYLGQTRGQLKERLGIYRQHIQQPRYEKIEVERYLRTCTKGIFGIFPFCIMNENNKI